MQSLVVRPASSFWTFYCQQLDRKPLLSRVATGVVGSILSDSIAQAVARGTSNKGAEEGYDFLRTGRVCLYSALLGTPIAYKWFEFLDKVILPGSPKSPRAILTKTLMDQVLMAPLGTMLFFSFVRALEGRADEISSTLQSKLVPALQANYCFWPASHVVNFAFVPASQRILYLNAMSVIWGAFLTHLVNDKKDEAPVRTEQLKEERSHKFFVAGRRVLRHQE